MRGWETIVLALAGCGRVGFGPLDISSDSGATASDTVDHDASSVAMCSPHPMLGGSGCLTGPGPANLWLFRDVVDAVVPDRSGRGCALLRSTGTLVADGIDVQAGSVTAIPGDLATTFDAIGVAQGVTLELWAHTVATPTATVSLARASDAVEPTRLRLSMSTSGSNGSVDGLGVGWGYSTFDPRDGVTRQLITFGNPSGVGYSISGFQVTISSESSNPQFPWQPSTSTISFGPWPGTIVRAAIYDRVLSDAEMACLNNAGADTIP